MTDGGRILLLNEEGQQPSVTPGHSNFGATTDGFGDSPPPYESGGGAPTISGPDSSQQSGNIQFGNQQSGNIRFGNQRLGNFQRPTNVSLTAIDMERLPLPENAPESYMCLAMCMRYSCCAIFGWWAVRYSIQSENASKLGNFTLAEEHAQKSLGLSIIGLFVGLAVIAVAIALIVIFVS